MASFWERVADELEYLGMTNKALAERVGITPSNVGKGIKQGTSPAVETAVKIAAALGVSVEYLVTGKEKGSCTDKKRGASPDAEDIRAHAHKFRKYRELLEQCDRLPPAQVKLLVQIAKNFAGTKDEETK